MKNNRKNIRSLAVAGVVVGLVLAACGDPDDPQGTAAGAQLPAVLGPASQAAVVEAALEVRANEVAGRKAESARLQGQADEYQARTQAPTVEIPQSEAAVIEEAIERFEATKEAQLPAVLGPASQAAVIEAAVEAHANDVAARSAESARLQGQADENQGRAEASTEETSDGTHTGESVSDLRMR